MTYSWIGAGALHTEAVLYEVTSLMSFFVLGWGFFLRCLGQYCLQVSSFPTE